MKVVEWREDRLNEWFVFVGEPVDSFRAFINELTDVRAWCRAQFGPYITWYWHDHYFAFEREVEATAFKLRWL